MKHLFITAFAIIAAYTVYAQTGSAKQVKWTYTSKKIADNTFEIRMTANIMGNYHMYAQKAGVEGPIPTSIKFTPNPLVTFNGEIKETGKLIKKYESAWPGSVNYYEKTVDFVQVIRLKSKVKTNLSGKIEFIVCNDNECLPPGEVEFKIPTGG